MIQPTSQNDHEVIMEPFIEQYNDIYLEAWVKRNSKTFNSSIPRGSLKLVFSCIEFVWTF